MAIATKCQTPGAVYHTSIRTNTLAGSPDWVVCGELRLSVYLPFDLRLSEEEAQRLENNLHNALELVLAPYFLGEVNE